MHLCMYTLGLCVHSYRDAHHKQTFASTSFQKNKGIFPSLHREGLLPKRGKATASLHSSTPLMPTALWEPNPSMPHFQRDHAQHSPISHLSPGADEGAKGSPAPLQAFPLQCNSLATQHFPTEGPPNAWIFSLFSFSASEASLLLAVEKPSFLESSSSCSR